MLTALLRLAGATTFAADVVAEDSLKAKFVRETGATYIDARQKAPQELAAMCCIAGKLDISIEAAGAATMAIALVPYMSRSSIFVLTGIPREETILKLETAELIRQMVRQNQVIAGSMNSNRAHFEKALRDMPILNSHSDEMLEKIIFIGFGWKNIKRHLR